MRVPYWKAVAAISALLLLARIADAAEVTLISTGAVKQALDRIITDYTKETGNQVKYTVGNPLIVSKKLADGGVFDVVVQSVPAMDDYAKLGGVEPDTRAKVIPDRQKFATWLKSDAKAPFPVLTDMDNGYAMSLHALSIRTTACVLRSRTCLPHCGLRLSSGSGCVVLMANCKARV